MSPRIIVLGNGNGFGGAQTAFREFANYLNERSFDWSAISIGKLPQGFPVPNRRPDGDALIIPYASRTVLDATRKVISIGRAVMSVNACNPSMVISIGVNSSAAIIFRICRPGVFKCAQDFIHDRSMNDPAMLHVAKHADCLATQTPSMMQRFVNAGYPYRNLTWLPCFSEQKHTGMIRAKRATNEVRLCYFGRIARNKGIELALRALGKLATKFSFQFDIWGEGEAERYSKVAEELNLSGNVTFKGSYKSGLDLAKLMITYDGLILTSTDTEGLPLVPIEAMAYGLPLLVTDVGSMSELAMNNPDVVLAMPHLDSLITNLDIFFTKIANGSFDPERQVRYYNEHFSREVFGRRWSAFLEDPHSFVASSAHNEKIIVGH